MSCACLADDAGNTPAVTTEQPDNDTKACNMHQPCTAIATIAKDPEFRVTTAMLWIRSTDFAKRGATTQLFGSQGNSDLPTIVLNDDFVKRADTATAVRYDRPDLGLLRLHRDRLAAAAEAFGWQNLDCLADTECSLRELSEKIEKYMSTLEPLPSATIETRKVRVSIDINGKITIDSAILSHETQLNRSDLLATPFMPNTFDLPIAANTTMCKIYLDRQPTRPSTLTTHKTTHRCTYTSARARLNMAPTVPPTTQEVLLYNPYGEIIESSNCTVYFKRDGQWITPAAICGPNLGVTRRLAIEKGLCRQGTIELRELKVNEEVWLSNAVRGFFRGVLTTHVERLSESAEGKDVVLGRVGYGKTLKSYG